MLDPGIDLSKVPRVGIEDAWRRHQGGALFVDVRGHAEFEKGHIPGAVSLPLSLLSQRLGELPRDRSLVFY